MRAAILAVVLLASFPPARLPTTSWSRGAAGATASGSPSTARTATPCARGATTASSWPTTTPAAATARAPGRRMRVRLKRARAPKLSGASVARAANGRRVRLVEARTYRFVALGPDRVEVVDTSTGRTRARLRAPVTVTGGATTTLRGTAENGLQQRRLPRRDRARARRRRRARRQPALARALPVRRDRRRDARVVAGRGAEGAGRGRPLVRAAQPPPGLSVRRVRRRPLAGLPRRGRRRRPRPRRRCAARAPAS